MGDVIASMEHKKGDDEQHTDGNTNPTQKSPITEHQTPSPEQHLNLIENAELMELIDDVQTRIISDDEGNFNYIQG